MRAANRNLCRDESRRRQALTRASRAARRCGRTGWCVVLAVLLCGPAAMAAGDESEPGAEVRALEAQLRSLRLLNVLELSEAQSRSFLDAAEEMTAVTTRARREAAVLAAAEASAYAAFYEEACANVGFSPSVEKQTAEAHRRAKALNKRYCEVANRVADQALSCLSPAQKQAMAHFEQLAAGQRFRADGQQERELWTELREIHETRSGALTPVAHLLVTPGIAGCLRARARIRSGAEPEDTAMPAGARGLLPDLSDPNAVRVAELRQDINLVNLANGLNLTPDQMEVIVAACKRQGTVPQPEPAALHFDTSKGRDYRHRLRQAVKRVQAGRDLRLTQQRRLRQLRYEAAAAEQQARGGRGRRAARDRERAVEAVAAALTEVQQQVLVDYKPCLIPPKNLRDPVRAGQAHDSSQAERLLGRLRQVPDGVWATEREQILNAVLARIEERQAHLDAAEGAAAARELGAILDQARAMDDVDFQVNVKDLAADLAFLDRETVLRQALTELHGSDAVVDRKIAAFLVHPRMSALLTARLGASGISQAR